MEKAQTKFTVLFDNPFWIGVYERECDGRYEICTITFGAEPKDYEIYWFLLQHYRELKFSPSIESAGKTEGHINPKRMQRAIHRQTTPVGMGTKAQQALSLQRDQQKQERRTAVKERKEEEKQRRFSLRQQKRKEKHKGR